MLGAPRGAIRQQRRGVGGSGYSRGPEGCGFFLSRRQGVAAQQCERATALVFTKKQGMVAESCELVSDIVSGSIVCWRQRV